MLEAEKIVTNLKNMIVHIFNRLAMEFEFSRSFNSMMIWPEDMEDSSCLERHCSVLRMSLLWQPYSFFNTIGRDSARLTLKGDIKTLSESPMTATTCWPRWWRGESVPRSSSPEGPCEWRVCNIEGPVIGCLQHSTPVCVSVDQQLSQGVILRTLGQLHQDIGLGFVVQKGEEIVLLSEERGGNAAQFPSNRFQLFLVV